MKENMYRLPGVAHTLPRVPAHASRSLPGPLLPLLPGLALFCHIAKLSHLLGRTEKCRKTSKIFVKNRPEKGAVSKILLL